MPHEIRTARAAALSWAFVLLGVSSTVHATPPTFAKALRPGDTVMFVAPSGPLDRERVALASGRLQAMGFRVTVPSDLYRQDDYLAGTDDQRAAELLAAFRDPEVAAIFPGTGGYGATRILDQLDYELIRQHPKVLIGFSDITALHVAIQQRTGLVTFHTPNPMWGLGSPDGLSDYSAHWFWRAILSDRYTGTSGPGYVISPRAWAEERTAERLQQVCQLPVPRALSPGRAEGRLIGGNLSLVAALMGTPFEPELNGRILLLEDVGEAPYRVDRMLCTLQSAGKLDEVAGVVLGTFTRRENEDTSGEVRTIAQVLAEYFSDRHYPVLSGFPVGHHVCNATLPLGARYALDADEGSLTLLENPVQP